MNHWEEEKITNSENIMWENITVGNFSEINKSFTEAAKDDGVRYEEITPQGILVFTINAGKGNSEYFIEGLKSQIQKIDGVETIFIPVENQQTGVEYLSFNVTDSGLKQALEEKTLELDRMTKAYEKVHKSLMELKDRDDYQIGIDLSQEQ